MNKLEVKGLCQTFGKFKALDQVSFTLPAGSVYGFIGPNGAGKTTCLRILAGLDEPVAGTILINGTDLSLYPEIRRKAIIMMPDSLPEKAEMQVWEYLDYIGRANGKNAEQRQAALERANTLTGIMGMLDKKLKELSKGMKQQVSLTRLFLTDADIFLLDEPAAGLDPQARIELKKTLAIFASEGKTMLLSSHILSELEDMVNGVVMLGHGRIISSGKVADIVAGNKNDVMVLLNLSDDAELYLQKIKSYPWLINAEIKSPKQILLTLDAEENYLPAMQELFAARLPIMELKRHDLGLENLFLNVISKKEEKK